MIARAVRMTTIAGIELRLDPSVLVLGALVTWVFSGWFRADHGLVGAIALAAIGAVLVLLTTLAHELGHALEARHRGLEVTGITLLLFGGVTEMHAHGQSARDELAIAVVGPWVSLVCAALFGIVATFADALLPAVVADPVARVAGLLGWWNLLLAIFNLVPGAPLDGGRVLRAVLWMVLGDRLRALQWSVRAGQALAVLLVLGAGWLLSRAPGAWLPAAAFALVGVFLWRAASTELRQARIGAVLDHLEVGQLVGTPDPLPADVPDRPVIRLDDDLHTLVERFQGAHREVVVVDADGTPIGLLEESRVARALHQVRTQGTEALTAAAAPPDPPHHPPHHPGVAR